MSYWTGIIAILVILAGCSEAPEAKPAPKPQSVAKSTTAGGEFEVHMTPAPGDLPLNEHASLTIKVTRLKGDPAEDLSLQVDADMPAHKHGINTVPKIKSSGSGEYLVEGLLLHMPGFWEIYVDVTVAGRVERAVFPLNLSAQ